MGPQFGGPKTVKELHFGDDGRSKLITGINKLADAVGTTLGPSGRTVVLSDDFGNPHVTKDGVTVANYVTLQDEVENLGVTMMKQAARNTASKAGDGTTTSTILAHAIITEYINQGGHKYSFRDIKAGVDKASKSVLKFLDKRAVKVDDKRLEHVSVISANNDKELGKLISDAFKHAGDHGVVTMNQSPTNETYIDVVEGTHIKSNSKTQHFLTNPEKELAELDKPLIFLSASDIPNVRRIQDILEFAIKSNRAILIVAPLEAQPLAALAMNKVKGNIKVNVIDPPSFGLKRKDILGDLALLSGAKVMDDELGDGLDIITPDCLGEAARVISDKDGTTFIFDEKPAEVEETVATLREKLKDEDHHVLTKHIENRLALLCGGVAQIMVGGDTEVEVAEKKDRVDDAIHAVKAAKKDGILPGGGTALVHADAFVTDPENEGEAVGMNILSAAIQEPFCKIMENCGFNVSDESKKVLEGGWGKGIDGRTGSLVDMRKAGIIDPAMVTKQALQNAVSVSTTILSTDAVIANIREEI